PLMWSDPKTKPPDVPQEVVFPCGVVLAGDKWLVSAGVHDRWIEVLEWDAAAAASLLAGPTVNHPTRCVHLGRRGEKGCASCWRKDAHVCTKGRGQVRPQDQCETCELYEADG